ncbi:MAG: hypothetical protein IKM97_04380 [Clostridia bacterium]|nr:hypothetical protein [Clostridia bacterium]
MAIISFWSDDKKACGQTLAMAAIATQMSVEHNMKSLIIDAVYNDDTLERCFWNLKQNNKNFANTLNTGKIDIVSGAEGLISAIASNKATPEVISSYTKIVFKGLDVLPGLKTKILEDHEKSLMLYKDLLIAANKYYDLIFIDLSKSLNRETTKVLLENSSVIMYTFSPNLKKIDHFIQFKATSPLYKKGNILPLYTMSDEGSKYNLKNTTKYIGERKLICTVPYNTLLLESACEAGVAKFFLQLRLSGSIQDNNINFLNAVSDCGKSIIYKLQELQYKV